MQNAKLFQTLMLIVLLVVGILQFFDTPKILDYLLGVTALIFGLAGWFFVRKS